MSEDWSGGLGGDLEEKAVPELSPEFVEIEAPWQKLVVRSQDGLRLHSRVYGEPNAKPPVICLAGLTRNSRDFHDLAAYLSRDHEDPWQVISVDYRGRGDSDRDRDWRNYSIEQEARDVLAILTRLDVEHAHFVGTSRGGLIIFALTAMRPAILKSAVLNDIGPVVEAAGLARIKSYATSLPSALTMEDAAENMMAAHSAQFPALDLSGWEKLARQIYRDGPKRIIPNYDKKLLQGLALVDFTKPLPTAWPQFAGLGSLPCLVLRGERSDILSPETVEQMHEVHPGLVSHIIKRQGHAPLLWEKETHELIAAHLERAEASD